MGEAYDPELRRVIEGPEANDLDDLPPSLST